MGTASMYGNLICEHCGSDEVAIRLKGEDDAGWCQACDKETELLESNNGNS